jgi:hypothetical protein
MASYWIVVPRGNQELFDLLSAAFHGHSGFRVILDRRSPDGQAQAVERRGDSPELAADEIVVAEQAQRADAWLHGAPVPRSRVRVPARRRTLRRPAAPDRHRLLTL